MKRVARSQERMPILWANVYITFPGCWGNWPGLVWNLWSLGEESRREGGLLRDAGLDDDE